MIERAREAANAGGRVGGFLAALGDRRDGRIAARGAAIVVAHPDNETIGCGAQLGRLDGAVLAIATQGVPRAAVGLGFGLGGSNYAAARSHELRQALRIGGIAPQQVVGLGFADLEGPTRLVELARRLAALFRARRISLVVTHAYEGGHPDHDAIAFAVHAAAALLARVGLPLGLIEMPFFHAGPSGPLRQRFVPAPGVPELDLMLGPSEIARKRAMVAAHATQRAVLAPFSLRVERFRPAPTYDFTAPPNDGRMLYDSFGAGVTAADWCRLTTGALRTLGTAA